MSDSADSTSVILLVEDDADDALLCQRALRQSGVLHRVIHLLDGEDAIHYLNGDPPYGNRAEYPLPALVLLDLKMPRLSGFDVLAWLQERPNLTAQVRVIVLTGSVHPEDRQKAKQLGAVGYEVKPVAFSELIEITKKSFFVRQKPS